MDDTEAGGTALQEEASRENGAKVGGAGRRGHRAASVAPTTPTPVVCRNFLGDVGDGGRPHDAHPLQDIQGACGNNEDCEVRWTAIYAPDAVLSAPGAAAAPTLPEICDS